MIKIKVIVFSIYIGFFLAFSAYIPHHESTQSNNVPKATQINNFSLLSSMPKVTPKVTPKAKVKVKKFVFKTSRPTSTPKIISRGTVNTPYKPSPERTKTVVQDTVQMPVYTPKSTPKPVYTVKPTTQPVVTYKSNTTLYRVTSYDLSVASCGKSRSHPEFGITSSGYSLAGKSRLQAMTVAADTNILPYGTRVLITFDGTCSKYNGIYTVRDTGGAIRGYRLDLFMGDGAEREVNIFGVQKARVSIVK